MDGQAEMGFNCICKVENKLKTVGRLVIMMQLTVLSVDKHSSLLWLKATE